MGAAKMTRNITLAVDEEVLERVRLLAAEQKTTVNAMVREFLVQKASESGIAARRNAAVRKMLEMSRTSKAKLGKDWKFNREEIYAERLSGHKHNHLRSDGSKK